MDRQILLFLLSLVLILGTCPQTLLASQDAEAPMQTSQAALHAQETPEQLQRLVAPIALYPDSLVAQILARLPIQNKSSKQTDGCKRTLI